MNILANQTPPVKLKAGGVLLWEKTVEEKYLGGIYHVIARGNNKEYIFREDNDKGYFIKQIKEMLAGMDFWIYMHTRCWITATIYWFRQ